MRKIPACLIHHLWSRQCQCLIQSCPTTMVWVALAALLSNLCKFSTNFLIFSFSAGPNLLAQAGTAPAANSVTMNSKHIGASQPAWLIGLQKAVGNLAAGHSVTHSNSFSLNFFFFTKKRANSESADLIFQARNILSIQLCMSVRAQGGFAEFHFVRQLHFHTVLQLLDMMAFMIAIVPFRLLKMMSVCITSLPKQTCDNRQVLEGSLSCVLHQGPSTGWVPFPKVMSSDASLGGICAVTQVSQFKLHTIRLKTSSHIKHNCKSYADISFFTNMC